MGDSSQDIGPPPINRYKTLRKPLGITIPLIFTLVGGAIFAALAATHVIAAIGIVSGIAALTGLGLAFGLAAGLLVTAVVLLSLHLAYKWQHSQYQEKKAAQWVPVVASDFNDSLSVNSSSSTNAAAIVTSSLSTSGVDSRTTANDDSDSDHAHDSATASALLPSEAQPYVATTSTSNSASTTAPPPASNPPVAVQSHPVSVIIPQDPHFSWSSNYGQILVGKPNRNNLRSLLVFMQCVRYLNDEPLDLKLTFPGNERIVSANSPFGVAYFANKVSLDPNFDIEILDSFLPDNSLLEFNTAWQEAYSQNKILTVIELVKLLKSNPAYQKLTQYMAHHSRLIPVAYRCNSMHTKPSQSEIYGLVQLPIFAIDNIAKDNVERYLNELTSASKHANTRKYLTEKFNNPSITNYQHLRNQVMQYKHARALLQIAAYYANLDLNLNHLLSDHRLGEQYKAIFAFDNRWDNKDDCYLTDDQQQQLAQLFGSAYQDLLLKWGEIDSEYSQLQGLHSNRSKLTVKELAERFIQEKPDAVAELVKAVRKIYPEDAEQAEAQLSREVKALMNQTTSGS